MKPIINPWIFYLINVINNLSVVLSFALIIMMVIYIYKLIVIHTNSTHDRELSIVKNVWKTFIAICVVIVVLIFLPSEETMYTMLVSNYVTYDNVEKATNVIKDNVDYIFDKIDGEQND